MPRQLQLVVDDYGWVTIRSDPHAHAVSGSSWHYDAGWQRQGLQQGWQGRGWPRAEQKQLKDQDDEKVKRLVARIAKLEDIVDYLEKERKKDREERRKEHAAVAVRLKEGLCDAKRPGQL
eukprot:TRINITY_DN27870_c0_g1_i1.p2 TRINITY_DN27870_c0_g1~~TRINITY_DN27870_c0_g1_i1.p2  ORF type:complete len:120 (+),score=26.59 TRINITY_DN27870_c0_g1_i1:50-409(+)